MKGPTHMSGNTLDLIISRQTDNLINNRSVFQDIYMSDHMAVIGYLNVAKLNLVPWYIADNSSSIILQPFMITNTSNLSHFIV